MSKGLSLLSMGLVCCTVAEVDLGSKSCPCEPSLVCEKSSNTCKDPAKIAKISAFNLRLEWATPNALRWRWDSDGDSALFGGYRLSLATSANGFEAADVQNWDGARNPELAHFKLTNTDGTIDPVVATFTDGLPPNKAFFARLSIFDTSGTESLTNVAQGATTFEHANSVTLFDATTNTDEMPIGANRLHPAAAKECLGGKASCYAYVATDQSYQNLKVDFRAVDEVSLRGSHVPWDKAYWEVQLAADSNETENNWSSVWLELGSCKTPFPCLYRLEPYTPRGNSAWTVLQIPLRFLKSGSGTLTDVALDDPVHEVNFGGSWPTGAHVWIADSYVRW